MEAIVSRLETVAQRLESVARGGPQSSESTSSQPYISAFNELLAGVLTRFLGLSSKIGGDVATQAGMVEGAFKAQFAFLVTASGCKKPLSEEVLSEMVKSLSHKILEIQTFKDQNRRSVFINHLSCIAESIPALGWVLVVPTPGPHVKEMADAGQFYSNRVLKDFKEKDAVHVEWVKAWLEVLSELAVYVKNYHTTGVSWNSQGVEARSGAPSAPPPPPMMPPPPPAPSNPSLCQDSSDSRAQLFSQLNKGEGITNSLKKVTNDQKTHKNPALRAAATPQALKSKPQVPVKTVGKAAAVKKPPRLELQGKKWIVEHHQNNNDIKLTDTEMKQVVYIYNCNNCTIVIKGKINAITMDNCKKTALMFEECIASLDFVNCQSVKAQVTGKVPIVNIDKTDGCMLYLSKESLSTHIVSAKSSEMNVSVPDDKNEFKELPIPEQFMTYWDGTKLVTEVTDISLG